MPTVTLNKKQVLLILGKKLDDDSLALKISMLGTDLEGITDNEIVVEVFPNRPDLMSEAGMARALRGFMDIETGLLECKIYSDKSYVAKVDASVKDVREHTMCAVVKDVDIDDELIVALMQMQEKLHMTHSRNRKNASIGVHDLDAVKFPVTYTTVGGDFKFVPLDFTKEMTIGEILLKHPKGKAYRHLALGKKYPVWLDADGEVLSFPPIINAAKTIVTAKTRNLFIEVTGLDRKATEQALNILVTALADEGGKLYSVKLDGAISPRLMPSEMGLSVDYVNKLLGLGLSGDDVAGLLLKMRYGVKPSAGGMLSVLVPAYRTDILHPIDLVEDVAIAYGYENFREDMPKIATVGEESKETILVRKVTDAAIGFGLLECISYHLVNKEHLTRFVRKEDDGIITTANAVNVEYNALRNALLPGLFKILSENTRYEYPQRLFEAGKVIVPDKSSETNAREMLSLSVVIADTTAEFTEIKAVLSGILDNLGVTFTIREAYCPSYIDGRCAQVIVDDKSVGYLGEVHPQVLNNFNIEAPVSAFEIQIDKLGLL
ncbi:MAG: phenylalanine--tRNA ligase subunit beta [archaeon]